MNKNGLTLCKGCNCMTKSNRIDRVEFVCPRCGYDKSLEDIRKYELNDYDKNMKCPDNCKHKDILCVDCVGGNYFDANAQD